MDGAGVATLPVAADEVRAAPDLVLVRGGFIVGKVVDGAGNGVQPGIAADVGLYGPSRPRPGAAIELARVAADGSFRLRVAPGSNYVYLRGASDYTSTDGGSKTVDVAEGQTVEIEFRVRSLGGPEPQTRR